MTALTSDELIETGTAFYDSCLQRGDALKKALAETIREIMEQERQACIDIIKSWAGHFDRYGATSRTVQDIAEEISSRGDAANITR